MPINDESEKKIQQLVATHAAQQPDSVALWWQDEPITYAALNDRVLALATRLASSGAQGDRVAVLAWNCPEFVELIYAVPSSGKILVPLNARLAPAELQFQVEAAEVFPDVPLRQWVISFPFPLRYLFAAHPQAMGKVLGVIYRAISTHLIHKAGYRLRDSATGAVTLIQRFGSALNLNIHFHVLFLDGVYAYRDNRPPRFQRVKAPDKGELEGRCEL